MLALIKHIFKKHLHNAIAILALLFIIAAIPDSDIRTISNIDPLTVKKVMNVGQTSFQGVSSGTLAVKGHYTSNEKAIFNIFIMKDVSGEVNFRWNKNNGSYSEPLPITHADIELSDGIIIQFSPNTDYQSGDNWAINSGIPARFNLASVVYIKTGKQIAALYSNFSDAINRVAANVRRLFAPQSK